MYVYLQVQRKYLPDNVFSVCTYKYNVNVYLTMLLVYVYLQVQRKCIRANVVCVCTYKYNVNVYLTMVLVYVPTSIT